MPLESLLKLAETLKGRISDHNSALSASETLTRYALIDPLLRELGWDTSDPSAVVPEYSSGSGRADYALMSSNRPAMMVEAKKLGTPLRDRVLEQGIGYCLMEGTPHFAVTDGAVWEIYETHSPVPIDQKRIVEFNLSSDAPAAFCLKALALWRPSVESGSVAPAQSPIIAPSPVVVIPNPLPRDEPVTPPPGDWRPLTDIGNAVGQKPAELLLPDNTRVNLTTWISMSSEIVRWLFNNGHITKADFPMKTNQRAKRYLINASPVHSDGQRFKLPSKVNDFYIEGNYNAQNHIKVMASIIERVGQAPSQFRVRFA